MKAVNVQLASQLQKSIIPCSLANTSQPFCACHIDGLSHLPALDLLMDSLPSDCCDSSVTLQHTASCTDAAHFSHFAYSRTEQRGVPTWACLSVEVVQPGMVKLPVLLQVTPPLSSRKLQQSGKGTRQRDKSFEEVPHLHWLRLQTDTALLQIEILDSDCLPIIRRRCPTQRCLEEPDTHHD